MVQTLCDGLRCYAVLCSGAPTRRSRELQAEAQAEVQAEAQAALQADELQAELQAGAAAGQSRGGAGQSGPVRLNLFHVYHYFRADLAPFSSEEGFYTCSQWSRYGWRSFRALQITFV